MNKYVIIVIQIKRESVLINSLHEFYTLSDVQAALKAAGLPNYFLVQNMLVENNQLTLAFGADYFFSFLLSIYIIRLINNISDWIIRDIVSYTVIYIMPPFGWISQPSLQGGKPTKNY